MKEKKQKNNRKWWFRFLKKLMKSRYKKPNFVYLGEEITNGAMILSNHEGTDAPMSFEIYSKKPIRFWGSFEMNSGLRRMYSYQTKVYYHEKKHCNLFLARLFCLIASPLTNLFYKGLNLISTYPDARLKNTLKESFDALKNGENIVIFPEKSTEGYKDVLDGFHAGFVLLGDYTLKNGMDLPIFVSYFNKKKRVYIVDKPVLYSELKEKFKTKEEIAQELCDRCNKIGALSNDDEFIKKKLSQNKK